jgi:hypothetical protein
VSGQERQQQIEWSAVTVLIQERNLDRELALRGLLADSPLGLVEVTFATEDEVVAARLSGLQDTLAAKDEALRSVRATLRGCLTDEVVAQRIDFTTEIEEIDAALALTGDTDDSESRAREHALAEALAEADRLVSKAHDIVWATYPEWEGDAGRREPLNAALWKLHHHLRPLIEYTAARGDARPTEETTRPRLTLADLKPGDTIAITYDSRWSQLGRTTVIRTVVSVDPPVLQDEDGRRYVWRRPAEDEFRLADGTKEASR